MPCGLVECAPAAAGPRRDGRRARGDLSPVADDPRAAALGKALFFDTRLSGNGRVDCASCHAPDRQFQDGLPLAHGMGTTGRRTMPLAGAARLPFLFWGGRKDSLWSQALGPLESAVEHGGDRLAFAHVIATAGERGPCATRFDAYAADLATGGGGDFSAAETEGLRLFAGKGRCLTCHNGPLFSDGHSHNTGVADPGAPRGWRNRRRSVQQTGCLQRRPARSLRRVALHGGQRPRPVRRGQPGAPYACRPDRHAGGGAGPLPPPAGIGQSELRPVAFTPAEVQALAAFLRTLDPAGD